jgi:hypothetical protein
VLLWKPVMEFGWYVCPSVPPNSDGTTFIHTHIYENAYIHTYIYVRTYIYIYVRTYIHLHKDICKPILTYKHMYTKGTTRCTYRTKSTSLHLLWLKAFIISRLRNICSLQYAKCIKFLSCLNWLPAGNSTFQLGK